MRLCDLHTHSHFSDGSYTPTELIKEASELGLSAIALCDHNTTDGLDEFLGAAKKLEIRAIPGVEFSTEYDGREVHIIALYVEPEQYEKIAALVAPMHADKDKSNRALLEALEADGIHIRESIDAGEAKHINRAHFAEALYRCGYASSIKDAFEKFLKPGGRYYTPAKKIDSLYAVRFIKSIGALCVLAHPYLSFDSVEQIRKFLKDATPLGLDAMEVYYSTYDSSETESARALACEFSLLESGGSDFHGTKKSYIKMAVGKGSLAVSEEVERALFEKWKSQKHN